MNFEILNCFSSFSSPKVLKLSMHNILLQLLQAVLLNFRRIQKQSKYLIQRQTDIFQKTKLRFRNNSSFSITKGRNRQFQLFLKISLFEKLFTNSVSPIQMNFSLFSWMSNISTFQSHFQNKQKVFWLSKTDIISIYSCFQHI